MQARRANLRGGVQGVLARPANLRGATQDVLARRANLRGGVQDVLARRANLRGGVQGVLARRADLRGVTPSMLARRADLRGGVQGVLARRADLRGGVQDVLARRAGFEAEASACRSRPRLARCTASPYTRLATPVTGPALPDLRLALLAPLLLLAGCTTYCESVDGSSEVMYHRHHCDVCGSACAFPGIVDVYHRCLDLDERDGNACGLEPGWRCAPGYHDLDDAPGCECRGPSPDDCQPCGAELPATGLDEDCDLRVDELIPNDDRSPRPPNGPAGALPDDAELRRAHGVEPQPVTRTACGAAGVSCALPGGAADVRCAPTGDGVTCQPADVAPVAESTHRLVGGEVDCTDGVDNDGNGVIDDGPRCQTLVPSVAAPTCHGKSGSLSCPFAYVPLDPSHLRLRGSDKPLVARMSYDILVDRQEATVGQVQRFLHTTGQCDNPGGKDHPLCDETGDPALPAGGLDWCVAYEYCQHLGKRIPTELEWMRAFGGTTGGVSTGAACDEGGQTATCAAMGPRRVGASGGHAAKGQHGESVITDAIGNVAEWIFDARIDPCEAPWAVCERGLTYADDLPLDPVVHAPADDLRRPRLLRGGSWAGEPSAASVEGRQFADPGVEVEHYGVRCVQTFRPISTPGMTPIDKVPYDSTATALDHAWCEPMARPERFASRSRPYRLSRATEACIDGVERPDLLTFVEDAFAGTTPLLLSVTDERAGAATMAIETGLVPGAEAFWLHGQPASLHLVREGCTPFGCRADEWPQGSWVTVRALDDDLIRLPLVGMEPIFGVMPTCLPPTPFGETAWRLDLRLPLDAVDAFFRSSNARAAACLTLTCADDQGVDEAACATECESWALPVDVQMIQLTVP